MKKRCALCKELLDVENFYTDKRRKDRLHPWCKPCFAEKAIEYKRRKGWRGRRKSVQIIDGVSQKWCSVCKEYLPFSRFGSDKTAPTKLSYGCKQCINTAKKNRRLRDPEKAKRLRNARAKMNRDEWAKFKRSLKCEICSESHISCLQFHHIDPSKKSFTISVRARDGNSERIAKEIKKCRVFCANCHFKFHWCERNNVPFPLTAT